MIALAIKWKQVIHDVGLLIGAVSGLVASYGVGATIANPYPEVVAETPISYPHYVFLATVLGAIVVGGVFGGTYVIYRLCGVVKRRWTYDNLENRGENQ